MLPLCPARASRPGGPPGARMAERPNRDRVPSGSGRLPHPSTVRLSSVGVCDGPPRLAGWPARTYCMGVARPDTRRVYPDGAQHRSPEAKGLWHWVSSKSHEPHPEIPRGFPLASARGLGFILDLPLAPGPVGCPFSGSPSGSAVVVAGGRPTGGLPLGLGLLTGSSRGRFGLSASKLRRRRSLPCPLPGLRFLTSRHGLSRVLPPQPRRAARQGGRRRVAVHGGHQWRS